MIRMLLIILFIIAQCNIRFNRKAAQYSSLLGFISALSASAGAKLVSTDFISSSTLAPIVIAKTRKLGFTLDAEMSTSCELTFNGTVVSSTVSLSKDKKTVYFTPDSSGWPVKLDSVTYINSGNCKDAAGNSLASQGTGLPVYIADTVTYASANNGNDAGTGTDTDPVKTLAKALANATASCPGACAIALKGGTYTVSASVFMPANISIFGGFDPSDWKLRRADKTMLAPYDTILDDTSVNVSGLATSPYSTVSFNAFTGTGDKSILDGIIIKGPVSGTAFNFGAPLGFINIPAGSGFTVRNTVTLDRSSSLNFTSAGFIGTNNAGKIILYNSSLSASADMTAAGTARYGIYYNGSSAGSELSVSLSELLGGGATSSTAGFFSAGVINGKVTLYQNTVKGGNNAGSDSVGVGIAFSGTDGFTVAENTISYGTSITNGYAVSHTSGSAAVISKNKISVTGGAINAIGIELAGTAGGAILSENEITAAGSGGNLVGIRTSVSATHSFVNNKITFPAWNGVSVKGMRVTGSTQVSGNTVSLAGCAAGTCNNTTGIDSNAGFPVYTSNTVSSGDCPNAGCASYGFNTTGGGGNVTFNGGTFTAGSSVTDSIGIRYNINQGLNVTGTTANGGTCSGASCIAAGFYSTGSTSGTTLIGGSFSVSSCTGMTCSQSAVHFLSTGAPLMTDNTMNAGNPAFSTATVRALYVSASGGTFKRNTFLAGSGTGNIRTVEMGTTANAVKMCSNVLVGGTLTGAGSVATLFLGNLTNGILYFYGNTFIGGQAAGPVDIAVFTATVPNFDFRYNMLAGNPGSAATTNCMNETLAVTYPAGNLDTNNFTGCSILYIDGGATNMTQICAGNVATAGCGISLASPAGTGNMNLSPVFANPASNDFHLISGTPAGLTTAVTAGILPVFSAACGDQLDRDSITRTSNSSLGAYK